MGKKKWVGLHYIDLCAGAGIQRLKGSNQLEWGSPLLAAQAKRRFDGLHLCEKSKKKCDALRERLKQFKQPADPQLVVGDANRNVTKIVNVIPVGALSLAFLDPNGLHLHFSTVQALAARKSDLIIFFPDRLDALRNWASYRKNRESNLDHFLGTDVDWRSAFDQAPTDKLPEVLRRLYENKLRTLGYTNFESERICAYGNPLYLLIFCTRHAAGLDIWRGVSMKKPDDQRTFPF
jgi:three-Cys-motif partner protein